MKYNSPKVGPAVTLTLLIVFFTFVGFITENMNEDSVVPEEGELFSPELVPEEGELFAPDTRPFDYTGYEMPDRTRILVREGHTPPTGAVKTYISVSDKTIPEIIADSLLNDYSIYYPTTVSSPVPLAPSVPASNNPVTDNLNQEQLASLNAALETSGTTASGQSSPEAQETFKIIGLDASGKQVNTGAVNYRIAKFKGDKFLGFEGEASSNFNSIVANKKAYSFIATDEGAGYEVSGYTTTDGKPLLELGGRLYTFNLMTSPRTQRLKDKQTNGDPTVIILNKNIGNVNFNIHYSVTVGKVTDPLYAKSSNGIIISGGNLKWLENQQVSSLGVVTSNTMGADMTNLFGAQSIKVVTPNGVAYINQYNGAPNHQSDFLRAEPQTLYVNGNQIIDEKAYEKLLEEKPEEKDNWESFTSHNIIGQTFTKKVDGKPRFTTIYTETRAKDGQLFTETFVYNEKGNLVGMAWDDGFGAIYYDKDSVKNQPGAEGAWAYKKGKDFQVHFERWFTQFKGLSGLSNILLGEETVDNWRRSIDESFGKFLNKEYWQATICESQYETPQESIMTIATPDGLPHILAHAEGERTDIVSPNGTEYLYKITWAVNNPEQANEELEFNVYLVNGNSRNPIYPQLFSISPGDKEIRSGEDAIVQYSNNVYNEICINFEDPVDQFGNDGETRSTVCNAITGYSGGATGYVDPNAQPTTQGTTGSTSTSGQPQQELQPGGVIDF